jgi:OOP family OmpA-OmpF porin
MNISKSKSRPIAPLFAGMLIVIFLVLICFSVRAESQEPSILHPMGALYSPPARAHTQLARLTFYRTENGQAAGVTSVVVNDRYQTSLQPGGYSDLCMKPSVVDVGASLQKSGERPKDLPEISLLVTAKAGQEIFIRVVDLPKARLSLVSVQPEVAFAELQKTRRQVHSISRVPGASACDQVTGSPAPKTIAVTLGTDALFAYGRSDVASILPFGREQLQRLAERLGTRYADFQHSQIDIIGYTDPVGSVTANQRLSEARAQTVKNYLVQAGVTAEKIKSEGRGFSELVDGTCSRVVSPISVACNKVNRRVVVEMSVRTD